MLTCLGSLGALPIQLPGFTDAGFPVQDKNGLFWVQDALRPAAATATGTGTTFMTLEEKGATQWGAAYAGASGSDWVARALQEGNAVLVKPSGFAAPAFKIFLTRDPYRVAYNAARSFQGDYAVLGAPSALVQRAEAAVRAGFKGDPQDYGPDGESKSGFLAQLPSWAVPVAAGAALLLAVAALASGRRSAA